MSLAMLRPRQGMRDMVADRRVSSSVIVPLTPI
jgi:hypothetical protein